MAWDKKNILWCALGSAAGALILGALGMPLEAAAPGPPNTFSFTHTQPANQGSICTVQPVWTGPSKQPSAAPTPAPTVVFTLVVPPPNCENENCDGGGPLGTPVLVLSQPIPTPAPTAITTFTFVPIATCQGVNCDGGPLGTIISLAPTPAPSPAAVAWPTVVPASVGSAWEAQKAVWIASGGLSQAEMTVQASPAPTPGASQTWWQNSQEMELNASDIGTGSKGK